MANMVLYTPGHAALAYRAVDTGIRYPTGIPLPFYAWNMRAPTKKY
jgi:hypothetical protein